MRIIASIAAVLLIVGPAAAQTWQEYSYPEYSFRVSFPADPQLETTTYQAADDVSVPARVYSIRQDNSLLKLTIAELAGSSIEENAVIDHAVKALAQGGEVKVNIPHRIGRVYGRQLSIVRADGSRTTAALFDYNGRLYQVEGTSFPNGNDATGDAIRFAQSLIFLGGGTNRSPEEIQAARTACLATTSENAGAEGATTPDGRRRGERRCRRAPF